jgi:hypothetical protein
LYVAEKKTYSRIEQLLRRTSWAKSIEGKTR